MRAPLLRLALAGAVLAALTGTATADSTGTSTLFFRNGGTDCGAGDAPFLSPAKGTTDLNCGYIGGGLPFGEVLSTAGQDASRTYATEASEAEVAPTFLLDDARDLAATIVVQAGSQQGVALPGAGQIDVRLALTAVDVDGGSVSLGSFAKTVTATPPARTVEVPFTVDLPASLKGVPLTGVSATLTVRGVHVFHGFARMNDSKLVLPVLPS